MHKQIKVQIEKGVHARTAALISGAAGNINKEFNAEIFIRKGSTSVPATSMLALNYLKIKNQDEIELIIEGQRASEAMAAMEKLFVSEDNLRITDLESFDAVLEAHQQRSEFIIDQMGDGVIYLDKNDVVVLANAYAERLIGMSRDNIIGNTLAVCFDSKTFSALMHLENSESVRIEVDGRNLECSKKTVQLQSGKGTMIMLSDVTALVSLDNELTDVKAVRARLGMVLDQLSDGVVIVDSSCSLQYANERAKLLFGLGDDQIGKLVDANMFKDIVNAVENRVYVSNKIIKSDQDRKLAVSISGLDREDLFTGVIGIFKELSSMRELIEKLDAATQKVERLEKKLEMATPLHTAFKTLVGESRTMHEALSVASRVAMTSTTVLVTGESGTGKELFAKAIHEASPRCKGPFVRVNCAAIPEALIESELFGHEKGSFTGAINKRIGKFEQAHGGTIFLDEIGEVPLQIQVKLLRVLQEFEVDRVGGTQSISVDVRVIAATNKNLAAMVEEKTFREDLFYRLNVIPIHLPPLRERLGDIPLLVDHFLEKIADREHEERKSLHPDVIDMLEMYTWPGNIRELENTLIRAVTLSEGQVITREVLPSTISRIERVRGLIRLVKGDILPLEAYEKEIIKEALRIHGSYNKAGKALGITHRTVGLKAKKYGLVEE